MDMTGINEEYIDVDSALKRIGGNMDLFKRLLGRFAEGTDFEKLTGALEGGDLEEAARLAHTIKGVSSNLSLNKIAAFSVQLEHLIKNGENYDECLSGMKQAYETTLVKITEIRG